MLIFCAEIETRPHRDETQLDTWIRRIAGGDQAALAGLYETVSTSVYSYALSILKNSQDAEDVLHDCFLGIYASAAGYRSEGKPLAWILTITRNLCLMRLREKTKERSRQTDIPEEDWESHLELSADMDADERMIVEECMRLLSDLDRQIVVLHTVSSMKHREIAHMLSMPLATVLSRYHRAIRKMRRYLEREE